jgi:hypothetical protein
VFFFTLVNYSQISTFFQTLATNTKGKRGGFIHLKSPKSDNFFYLFIYFLGLWEVGWGRVSPDLWLLAAVLRVP